MGLKKRTKGTEIMGLRARTFVEPPFERYAQLDHTLNDARKETRTRGEVGVLCSRRV